MRTRGLLITVVATAALLTGCVAAHVASPTRSSPSDVSPPSSSASATPSNPALADPASYPLPAEELSQGAKGVMFTAGETGLQCAIFDPPASIDTAAGRPEFGCEVSVDGFPYPPIVGGPADTANAFISRGHQAAVAMTVTDASYSGSTPAPPLPAGASITWSTVTCTALAVDEVRCVDAPSGHGMRVSIRDYEAF